MVIFSGLGMISSNTYKKIGTDPVSVKAGAQIPVCAKLEQMFMSGLRNDLKGLGSIRPLLFRLRPSRLQLLFLKPLQFRNVNYCRVWACIW